ncbi:hypothetical protein JL36_06450 [Lactococcus cremoris]|nr:hypothetical protein [Lactococcus cremoris]KGH33666.1 hypothetical protein JL36_06450 [Lactococcus cremoris]
MDLKRGLMVEHFRECHRLESFKIPPSEIFNAIHQAQKNDLKALVPILFLLLNINPQGEFSQR